MVSLILCTEPRDFRKMRHAGSSVSASDIPNFPTTNLISTDADAMMVEPVVAPDLSKVEVLPKKLDTNQPDRYDPEFFINNFHEYEQGISEPLVKGRLKASVEFWCAIGAEPEIVSIVCEGYKLPFVNTPPSACFKNNKSAIKYNDFVLEAVNELLAKNLIVECKTKPCVVNPLSVSVQSSGKLRLILDLRYVNQFLWKQKVKFEDWNIALEFFQQGDFMFSFDLKSGYHHFDIFKEHCKYLSFSWEIRKVVKYFSFQVLPFGLSTAPYIFTKCIRPLVRHWRKKGYFIIVFLDDGWCRCDSLRSCKLVSSSVKDDLLAAGFVPNIEKSVWTPTTKLNWLGMIWDSEAGAIRVIERRISDIFECIDRLSLKFPLVSARELASLAGKVMSLYPVVGNVSQLRTRFMYMEVTKRLHWDKVYKLAVDSSVFKEVFFWKENLNRLNNRILFEYSTPQVLLFSDASNIGCGAWTAQCGELKFFQNWKCDEIGKSSTWRELKGVSLAIEAFSPSLKGKKVKVFTDNTGVEVIMRKGSMKVDLHDLALRIADFCNSLPLEVSVQWVPRDENVEADILSRQEDFDDWGVTVEFFKFIDTKWGPHTVDRFADEFNHKLPVFNSKFWCPSTSQVDAFSGDWSKERNWLIPPISLVGRAIKHVKVCRALATLIVPSWPSAPFWPLLFSSNSSFSNLVVEVMRFSDPKHIFVQGRNPNSIFGTSKMTSEVLCLRLDGRNYRVP